MIIKLPNNFKRSPWRVTNVPSTLQRYIVFEKLKSVEHAALDDNAEAFVTNNKQVKEHGAGFHVDRLVSGQIQHVFFIEIALDCIQVCMAKSAGTVCLKQCCILFDMFWHSCFWCEINSQKKKRIASHVH